MTVTFKKLIERALQPLKDDIKDIKCFIQTTRKEDGGHW